MSSDSDDSGPGQPIETLTLRDDLNSTLLLVFGMGFYTAVFIGTISIYYHQKSNRSRLIVSALIALFVVIMTQLALQWRILTFDFVDEGDTRDSIYNSFLFNGSTLQFVNLLLNYCGNILADSLLLWRCYHMCGLSLQRISLPLFFFFSEIALAIASISIQGKTIFQPSFDTIQTENIGSILDGTVNLTTAITTLLGTIIICHRILSSTDKVLLPDKRYGRIIRVLIESASLYSVTSLLFAIVDFQTFNSRANVLTVFALQNYLSSLSIIATGVAPTLMVGRICLYTAYSDRRDTPASGSQEGTGLEFYVSPTIQRNESNVNSDTGIRYTSNATGEMEKEIV